MNARRIWCELLEAGINPGDYGVGPLDMPKMTMRQVAAIRSYHERTRDG